MKKVPHKFVYVEPCLHTDFMHCISFKLAWRGQRYGQFMFFSELEWTRTDTPYFCLRQLLREKHYLIEHMEYIEEHEDGT